MQQVITSEREKSPPMRLLIRITILLVGLSLCVVWPLIITPGSESNGHFYSFPINGRIVGVWVIGWCVILLPTLWLWRRLKRK